MLATLALAAQLAALPMPSEEVVSSTAMVEAPRPTGRAARLLVEGSAGMAAGLLLGLVSMESGVANLVPYDEVYGSRPRADIEGLRAGFGLGAGLGVYGAGAALDSDGSVIGMGLGMGVGATTALLVGMFAPDLAALASVTLPLAGAMAGYELGSADVNANLRLRPNFSVWNGRFNLGLTGNF